MMKNKLARSGNPSSIKGIFSFPTETSLNITNNFSVNLWIKAPNKSASANLYFLRRYNSATNNRIWGFIQRSSTRSLSVLNSSNGVTSYYNNGTKPIADGNWHNVGFTYSNKVVKIYVDGELDVSVTTSKLKNDLLSNPDIVMGNNSTTEDFIINKIKYYDRVLEEDEFKLLAKGISISKVGLVGEWDLNETTGTTLYNKSKHGALLDGTLTGIRVEDTPL